MSWSDFREPRERFIAEVSFGAELAEDAGGSQSNAVNQNVFRWQIELEANLCGGVTGIADADALFPQPFAGIGKILSAQRFNEWK